VSKTKEKILKLQESLEQSQRVAEDELIATLHAKRRREVASIQQEMDEEWERELKRLTHKYTSGQQQQQRPAKNSSEKNVRGAEKTL